MKNLKNIFTICLISVLIFSCTDEDKVLPTFEEYENGAYLRGSNLTNKFNLIDLENSFFEVELELVTVDNVQSINVYATYNGTNSVSEILIETMDPSSFNPTATYYIGAIELLSALNVNSEDLLPSDSFITRFEVEFPDGRTFSDSNSSANIGGGTYTSPFSYTIEFACPLLDASLFDGDYEVTLDEWADYGAGDVIPVVFVSGFTFRILATQNPYISNSATAYMEITIDEEGNVLEITSNEIFDFGVPIIPTNGGGELYRPVLATLTSMLRG